MTKTRVAAKIRCNAKLLQPAESENGERWLFLVLPLNASAKLPSRSMTAVSGTMNGAPFHACLEPDGQRSHWLKVKRSLYEAAAADAGDTVALEIAPAGEEPEPEVPADLQTILDADSKTEACWSRLTAVARRDWIQWITSAKRSETRTRRIENTSSMLAAGKRRVCCFDRSGIYSKGLSAPKAATPG
ncbi:MAG: YdeI/OmpD-associated family protein [Verrucomicrobiota bacterium]|nr:YdeI/OmpD-associated family protein [Verrucomicrobiota bacterium]